MVSRENISWFQSFSVTPSIDPGTRTGAISEFNDRNGLNTQSTVSFSCLPLGRPAVIRRVGMEKWIRQQAASNTSPCRLLPHEGL